MDDRSSLFGHREAGSRKRLPAEIAEPVSAIVMLLSVFLASALWNVVGPTLNAVLSALVQTGVTTRLVLLGLFLAGAFGVFTLRMLKQVWYGHAACVVALVVAWNMIARLAIQIQAADVVALAGAACLLVHGLLSIRQGHDKEARG